MPRTDEQGTEHPVGSDEVTAEGIRHIQQCAECRAEFPFWVSAATRARQRTGMNHNHVTRGIRPSGQCPACDEYTRTRVWQAVPVCCYKRHEPMPGVHQDVPHLNTECMEAKP